MFTAHIAVSSAVAVLDDGVAGPEPAGRSAAGLRFVSASAAATDIRWYRTGPSVDLSDSRVMSSSSIQVSLMLGDPVAELGPPRPPKGLGMKVTLSPDTVYGAAK